MSVAEILLEKKDAAEVRRLIRARCPILKDGAYAPLDGRITGEWFRRRVVSPALLHVVRSTAGQVAGSRRALSPADLRSCLEPADLTPLPEHSASTFVRVLPIAPHRMYAYWSATREALHEARLRLGADQACLTLRFYDVTCVPAGDATWFDVEVDRESDRRYLEVGEPGHQYHVEFGLRARDGHFLKLAESVRAPLPRSAAGEEVSSFINVQRNAAAIVRPSAPGLYRPARKPVLVRPGDRDWPLRDLHAEQAMTDLYQQFLLEGPRALRNKHPLVRPADDILRAAYDQRQAELKAEAKTGDKELAGRATRPVVAVRLDEEQVVRKPVRREAHLPSVRQQGRLSLQELGRLEREETISRLTTLASRGPLTSFTPAALPEPENKSPKPLRRKAIRVNRISHLLEKLAKSDLDLEAELVLRGRVKAGKKVRIGGQVIETEPDGSFCVSVVVKDGKIHVPVEVVEGELVTEQRDVSVELGQ